MRGIIISSSGLSISKRLSVLELPKGPLPFSSNGISLSSLLRETNLGPYRGVAGEGSSGNEEPGR